MHRPAQSDRLLSLTCPGAGGSPWSGVMHSAIYTHAANIFAFLYAFKDPGKTTSYNVSRYGAGYF